MDSGLSGYDECLRQVRYNSCGYLLMVAAAQVCDSINVIGTAGLTNKHSKRNL